MKNLGATIILVIIVFILSSCGEKNAVNLGTVLSEAIANVSSEVFSQSPSRVSSEVSETPTEEFSEVSARSNLPKIGEKIKDYEDFGEIIKVTERITIDLEYNAPETLGYLLKKEVDGKEIQTFAVYDSKNKTAKKIYSTEVKDDGSVVDPSIDISFSGGMYLYMDSYNNKAGFYDYNEGKGGQLPVNKVNAGYENYKGVSPTHLDGKIYWSETDYIVRNEKEYIYYYDIETDEKHMVYKSDGEDWMKDYVVTQDGVYILLIPITLTFEDNYAPIGPFEIECLYGNLVLYKNGNIKTIKENIYSIYLKNDQLYIEEDNGKPGKPIEEVLD